VKPAVEIRSQSWNQESDGDPGTAKRADEQRGLKVAEWVTLGVSLAIILGVAGYLLYQALQNEPPFIAPEIRPVLERVERRNGQYILPVEVRNPGRRTLRDLKIEISWQSAEGSKEHIDFTIDYLGESSTQTVFFYLNEDPKSLQPEVRPTHYRLD
jgi:uncharacterized protein (TIGR02588 family)